MCTCVCMSNLSVRVYVKRYRWINRNGSIKKNKQFTDDTFDIFVKLYSINIPHLYDFRVVHSCAIHPHSEP